MLAYRSPMAGSIKNATVEEMGTSCRVHHRFSFLPLVAALSLACCGEPVPKHPYGQVTRASTPSILAMGDSMLAWHRGSRFSISEELEKELDTQVIDRSVIAARYNYILPISGALGLNISKQYRKGSWDWVILNGGGNDLWFGCGCIACDDVLEKLISPDATTGEIPELVSRIRNDGAQVIYLGYLHSPGVFSIVDHCKDEALELESRLSRLAASKNGFYFLNFADLVAEGDRSFHSIDMIHPSIKASKFIGRKVADIIRSRPL